MSSPPREAIDSRQAVTRIVEFFETLSPPSLARIGDMYAELARFKDPFNDVRGAAAITEVFAHMFTSLHEPRFVVTRQIVDGDQAFLSWEFHFRFKRFDTRTVQVVLGGTHLQLAPDGRITEHRDYWDAAEELYEKLPVVGSLMRWLKARARS
jgi:steroid Delta-isomerase